MQLEVFQAAAEAGVFTATIRSGERTVRVCDLWGRAMPDEYELVLHVKRPVEETQVVSQCGRRPSQNQLHPSDAAADDLLFHSAKPSDPKPN